MALPTVTSVTSSIGSYPTVFYDRTAVVELTNHLKLYDCIEQKPLPNGKGVALQIFGYSALAANTTPSTDGTPQGAGVGMTATTGTINLSQYVDYITYSDKVIMTGVSDIMTEGARLLGYRGALTVDTVINTSVDTAAAADATSRIDVAHSSFLTAAVARKAVMQLRSVNAQPKASGTFRAVVHSLPAFDLINDSAAGGFQDIFRYIDPQLLSKGVDAGSQKIATIGGADWYESNSLPTIAYFASTGVNGYSAYVFGKDAFFGASLGKNDLGQRNFSVKTRTFDGTNSLDPAGVIRGASVYNFFFGLAKRPNGANTFRRITVESTIG